MKVLFALLLAFLFAACGDNAVKNDDEPETTPPSIAFNAATLASDSLRTVLDTLTLGGTASDASGIDEVSVQIAGDDTTYLLAVSGNNWSVRVGLLPGWNRITATARDEADNTAGVSLAVYYKTNYLPVTDSSTWTFRMGLNPLVITVDSAYMIPGFGSYFKLLLSKQELSLIRDTLVMAYDTLNRSYSFGRTTTDAYDSKAQPLFKEEYVPGRTVLSLKDTAVFIGDTRLPNALGDSVTYRNVVRVTVADTARQLIQIRDYFVVPGVGFVGLVTRNNVYYGRVFP